MRWKFSLCAFHPPSVLVCSYLPSTAKRWQPVCYLDVSHCIHHQVEVEGRNPSRMQTDLKAHCLRFTVSRLISQNSRNHNSCRSHSGRQWDLRPTCGALAHRKFKRVSEVLVWRVLHFLKPSDEAVTQKASCSQQQPAIGVRMKGPVAILYCHFWYDTDISAALTISQYQYHSDISVLQIITCLYRTELLKHNELLFIKTFTSKIVDEVPKNSTLAFRLISDQYSILMSA